MLPRQSLHSLQFNTVRCVNQPDWTPPPLHNSAACKFRAFLTPWSPARYMDDNFINSLVRTKVFPPFTTGLIGICLFWGISPLVCVKENWWQPMPLMSNAFFFFKQRKNIFLRLLTTMCAGDGDLASLRACLLWRLPAWTSSSGHFICRYWMEETKMGKEKWVQKRKAKKKNQNKS